MADKPDDVSLNQVRTEFRALQFERDNPSLFGILSRIESTLVKVDDRLENLEGDVKIVKEDVSKLDNKFEDLSIQVNEIREEMSSSKGHSVDQHPSLVASPMESRHNPFPQIYLDLVCEGKLSCSGRIVIKLYDDLSPNNCKNFRGLVARSQEGLKGSRIAAASYIIGGFNDNFGDLKSAIDPSSEWFPAELNELPYDKPGLLQSKSKSTSAFYITLEPEPKWNREKNGPFGEIISGLDLLKKIKKDYGPQMRSSKVVIADCGTLDYY